MGKKNEVVNERAKAGSGKAHDKHGEKKLKGKAHKRAKAGSGEQHDKCGPKEVAEVSESE